MPTDPERLYELAAELDQKMFDVYNTHDWTGLMARFADDLEFYHDKGGLLNHEQVTTGFTNPFANNEDIRRDLLAGSLEVCSIRGYGAIEVGAHRCRHMASGKRDCGTFRFMQIWRYVKDGTWTVSRKGSYAR